MKRLRFTGPGQTGSFLCCQPHLSNLHSNTGKVKDGPGLAHPALIAIPLKLNLQNVGRHHVTQLL